MSSAMKLAKTDMTDAEWQTRCELAALYHVVHHLGWTDLINTHMSARVPGEPDHFLINNYGEMFDEITASSLVQDGHGRQCPGDERQVQQRRLHHPQRRLQGAAGRQLRDAHAHPRRRRGVAAAQRASARSARTRCTCSTTSPITSTACPRRWRNARRSAAPAQQGSCVVLLNHGLLTLGADHPRRVDAPVHAGARLRAGTDGAQDGRAAGHHRADVVEAAARMRKLRDTPEYGLAEWKGLVRTVERKGADYRR